MVATQLINSTPSLHKALANVGSIGLVPTMGYLHEGHGSLIQQAARECDFTVVSVFVNAKQFAPHEDLARYPRDLDRDLHVASLAGAHILFHPADKAIYPEGYSTTVSVNAVSEPLEGLMRPGHFDGVATVVLKLLNIVQPQYAYFGEKDWQQLAVVRHMVKDLNVPVEIKGVPTVRQASGLALSSRNSYLTAEQQEQAAILFCALQAMSTAAKSGETSVTRLQQIGLNILSLAAVELEYLEVVGSNMQKLKEIDQAINARAVLAARMFGVRLIDNIALFS
jgi:pantoate--beta-alanine ligase